VKLLTRAEVAALLKVHVKTVARLTIPSVLLGKRQRRYRLEDVERWIEEHRSAA
jgi:excisionase family DNA binding protein